jgi:outer membrane protein OmpA-like peptidoglycan-associated protein
MRGVRSSSGIAVLVGVTCGACAPHRDIALVSPNAAYVGISPRSTDAAAARGSAPARVRDLGLLRDDLTVVKSRDSERGVVLTVPDALFKSGRAELKATAQRDLLAIGSYLKAHPSQHAVIESYAARGPRDLALRRGTTIETFFLRNAVDPERLEVRTVGGSSETATGTPIPARHRKDRRVDIVMTNGAETTAADGAGGAAGSHH